jgi:hypothetical protein
MHFGMLVRMLPAKMVGHLVLCTGNGIAELQCMQQSIPLMLLAPDFDTVCCMQQRRCDYVACLSMMVSGAACQGSSQRHTVYLYAGSSKGSTGHAAEASRQSSCCSSFHAASRAGPRSSPGPVRGRSFCPTCHVSFLARHLCPLKLLHLSYCLWYPYKYNADVASMLRMPVCNCKKTAQW